MPGGTAMGMVPPMGTASCVPTLRRVANPAASNNQLPLWQANSRNDPLRSAGEVFRGTMGTPATGRMAGPTDIHGTWGDGKSAGGFSGSGNGSTTSNLGG